MQTCKEFQCYKTALIHDLCRKHYNLIYKKNKKDIKCTLEDCFRGQFCKGLCRHHYRKTQEKKKCTRCNERVFKKDLCNDHYIEDNPRCIVEGCLENIYVKSKLLCRSHYEKESYKNGNSKKRKSEMISGITFVIS